jgi:hypothetical protein
VYFQPDTSITMSQSTGDGAMTTRLRIRMGVHLRARSLNGVTGFV